MDSLQKRTYLGEILNNTASKHVYSVLGDRKDDQLSLTIQSSSYSPEPTKNSLTHFSAAPFPLRWLSELRLESENNTNRFSKLENLESERKANFFYQAQFEKNIQPGLLTLSQSFDPGWVAFQLTQNDKPKRLEHVNYNGWANGWIVAPSNDLTNRTDHQSTVIILYWPQLLEFAGFGVLAIAMIMFAVIAFRSKRKKHLFKNLPPHSKKHVNFMRYVKKS